MSSAFWRFNQSKVTKNLVFPNLRGLTKSEELEKKLTLKLDRRNIYLIGKQYKYGNFWTSPALRLKSDIELKALWYVLLKEKNKIASEENYLAQISSPSNLITDAKKMIIKSMKSLKSVLDQRMTHKNNMMNLLEFFYHKKTQYTQNFNYKYPELQNQINPMYSKLEQKQIIYLLDYLENYKILNKNKENFEKTNDFSDLHKIVPINFNPLDPIGLFDCFEEISLIKDLNELYIAKRNFYFIVATKINGGKRFKDIINENYNSKILKLEGSSKSKNEEKNVSKSENNKIPSIMKINENDETKETALIEDNKVSSEKNSNENEEINKIKETIIANTPEFKNILNAIVYFTDLDNKLMKRSPNNENHRNLKKLEKESSKYIINLLSNKDEIETAKFEFYEKLTSYLNKVKKLMEEKYNKFRENRLLHLKDSKEAKFIDEKTLIEEKLKNNLQLGMKEVEKEIFFAEILNNKIDDYINLEIKSRIIDDGIKKLLLFDIPTLKSKSTKHLKSNDKINEKSDSTKNTFENAFSNQSISVLTQEEKIAAENLKIKTNVMNLLPIYVNNSERYRADEKKFLINKIQRGRSKLARYIFLKELAAISYQSKKLQNEFNTQEENILLNSNDETKNSREGKGKENNNNDKLSEVDEKNEKIEKMKQESLKQGNKKLEEILEEKKKRKIVDKILEKDKIEDSYIELTKKSWPYNKENLIMNNKYEKIQKFIKQNEENYLREKEKEKGKKK